MGKYGPKGRIDLSEFKRRVLTQQSYAKAAEEFGITRQRAHQLGKQAGLSVVIIDPLAGSGSFPSELFQKGEQRPEEKSPMLAPGGPDAPLESPRPLGGVSGSHLSSPHQGAQTARGEYCQYCGSPMPSLEGRSYPEESQRPGESQEAVDEQMNKGALRSETKPPVFTSSAGENPVILNTANNFPPKQRELPRPVTVAEAFKAMLKAMERGGEMFLVIENADTSSPNDWAKSWKHNYDDIDCAQPWKHNSSRNDWAQPRTVSDAEAFILILGAEEQFHEYCEKVRQSLKQTKPIPSK